MGFAVCATMVITVVAVVAGMCYGVNEVFYRCFRSENPWIVRLGVCLMAGETIFFGGKLIMNFESLVLHPEDHRVFAFNAFVIMLYTLLGVIRGILTKTGKIEE